MAKKVDLSGTCDKDDENSNNDCWSCTYFHFPIGCMYFEEREQPHEETLRAEG